ncbi:MAG: helix-hairpin-helix domain-containing protein, partial [Thermoplasmatales archaeon]
KEGDSEIEIDAFKDINSIDQKIAKLLYENGISCIGDLIEKNIKDLTKIKGIKRKLAKKIKKEVESIVKKNDDIKTFEGQSEELEEWECIEEGFETKRVKGYKYKKYMLYEKEVELKSGKKRKIHFFSKKKPDEGKPIKLPKGYRVKINKKTGVPYLKKKK